MRPPSFWNYKEGRGSAPFARTALRPLGWLYARATARRIASTVPYDPGVSVICVGNANMGGTGKTPIAAYLLESLNRMDIKTVGLTRGYGGREKGPVLVRSAHSFRDVGDEAILLARSGPVWVAAGRDDGARAARARGAKVIVMDDGHQNPLLKKILSLLVVDAVVGFGNELVFPAGPLREPIKAALARTDAIILMKPYQGYEVDEDLLAHFKGLRVIAASLEPKQAPPKGKLFAFAGIGRPEKFFDSLVRAGADLSDSIGYADHYVYKPSDLKNLYELAREYEARLITTEKDFVRLPDGFQKHVTPWPVAVQFEDELTVRRLLHPIISSVKQARR